MCLASVVTVLDLVEPDFQVVGSFEHPYPPTKVAFGPEKARSDLLATSGDYLRLWQIRGNEIVPKVTLNQNKSSEFCAPLTSFDWNESVPSMIGTCSIDTTCKCWCSRRKLFFLLFFVFVFCFLSCSFEKRYNLGY